MERGLMKRIGYILMMCAGILCISAVKAHTYTFLNYTDKNVKIRWILLALQNLLKQLTYQPNLAARVLLPVYALVYAFYKIWCR